MVMKGAESFSSSSHLQNTETRARQNFACHIANEGLILHQQDSMDKASGSVFWPNNDRTCGQFEPPCIIKACAFQFPFVGLWSVFEEVPDCGGFMRLMRSPADVERRKTGMDCRFGTTATHFREACGIAADLRSISGPLITSDRDRVRPSVCPRARTGESWFRGRRRIHAPAERLFPGAGRKREPELQDL